MFFYNLLWIITSILVLSISIYYTIKLKGIWFNIFKMIKEIKKKDKGEIKTFKILSLSLAARIGIGSLAGTAFALLVGGAGAIFWMWVTTLFTISLTYVESMLGNIYHKKNKDIYIGGPSYYIKDGLGYNKLSIVYSILIILGYIVGFMSIQANTITNVVYDFIHIDKFIIGIIISILCGSVIIGGVKEITNITSRLVPVMSLFFIIVSLYILIINYDKLFDIFCFIIKSGFNFNSFKIGVLTSFITGIQRSIFASESGIGTSAITSALAKNNPKKQGFIQIIGVYFTIFIIVSLTAFVILLSNVNLVGSGISITSNAYSYFLGNFGTITIIITIILFGISTIISGYYYGESNLFNICKKDYSMYLKIITIIILLISSIISSSILWYITDIFVAFLAVINIYSLYKLRRVVFLEGK